MKNFIKARLNRDNFWNLMLWFGMSLGWAIGVSISESPSTISTSIVWLTLLGVPYAVKKANKLSFDKEKGFFNKEGRSLKSSYPKNIFDIIILTFLLFPLECFIGGGLSTMLSLFLLPLVLYFILKNCPITILFYKNAWCKEVTGMRPMTPEEAARFNSISFRRSNDSYERRHSSSHSFNFNNVYYRK
jgi:hypothetical protein